MSLDYGDTHRCVSIVTKRDDKYCVLENAEGYYNGEWQEFIKRDAVEDAGETKME